MRTCPICHSKKDTYLLDEKLHLWECKSCIHRFSAIEIKNQKQYKNEYFSKEHANWFKNPDLRLFAKIQKHLSDLYDNRPFYLLDVGCGKGDFLVDTLKKYPKAKLYGIDLIANSYPGINFINGDWHTAEIDMKFDAITCLHVIEHVNNPHAFIKKVFGILKHGGYFFIGTIDSNSLIYKIAHILNRFRLGSTYARLYSAHHLQHFTKSSLKKFIEANNFKEVEQFNYNYSIRALDLPGEDMIQKKIFLILVYFIFLISSIFKKGIAQLALYQKTNLDFRHIKHES